MRIPMSESKVQMVAKTAAARIITMTALIVSRRR